MASPDKVARAKTPLSQITSRAAGVSLSLVIIGVGGGTSVAGLSGVLPAALLALVLGLLLLGVLMWARVDLAGALPSLPLVALFIVASAAGLVVIPLYSGEALGHVGEVRFALFVTYVIAAVLICFGPQSRWIAAPMMASVWALVGAIQVASVGLPPLDAWFVVQEAAGSILRGENPYTIDYPLPIAISDSYAGSAGGYPYPPGCALLLAPFRLVFGDVRWGLLAAVIATAVLLIRRAPVGHHGWAGALVLLAIPGGVRVVQFGWSEPLTVALLVAAVLAAERRRGTLAVVLFALALTTKQTAVLALLPLAFWRPFGFRRVLASGALAALVCLPWFLADPQAFTTRVGGALLLGQSSVRTDSMSLGGLAAEFDLPMPRILLLVLLALVVFAAIRAARAWPEAEGAVPLLATALLMAGVLVLSTHAFYNHWWAVMALLAAGLACLRPRPGHGSVSDRSAEGRTGKAEVGPSVL